MKKDARGHRVFTFCRALVTHLMMLVLSVCTGAPPPPPSPQDTGDLVRRHYDQACQVESGVVPAITVAEIFDTLGLARQLGEIGAAPLPPGSRSAEVRWATLDFITRYGRDGQPKAAGAWATTLDSTDARTAEGILRGRIRALPGLLESEGFRTVVEFAPRPTLEVGPPIMCLPHVVHEPHQRPAGLPPAVSTWLEFRSRRRTATDPRRATVRIGLDRQGRVAALDPVAGDSVTLAASRDIISRLRFDPALRNGEPIVGELVQSFAFPPGYLPGR